jgi:hypothetical protein
MKVCYKLKTKIVIESRFEAFAFQATFGGVLFKEWCGRRVGRAMIPLSSRMLFAYLTPFRPHPLA